MVRFVCKDVSKLYHIVQHSISFLDTSYVLLPKRASIVLPRGTLDKLIGHLCTRFSATPSAIRRALPQTFEQWARLRIDSDSDVVRAASMLHHMGEDNRNATYVRVSGIYSSLYRIRTYIPLDTVRAACGL
jgi:hypothetical protein